VDPVLWRDHAFEDLGGRSHLLHDLRKLAAGIVTVTGLLCGRAQQRISELCEPGRSSAGSGSPTAASAPLPL
jgi:hypothetical protein